MRAIKAVVYHAPQDVRVDDIPMPHCGPDEIRVKVDACAVCGSDLKAYKSGNPRIKPPMVIGHEFTGLVEAVGARVKGYATADRIVMATSISCGQCLYCRRGWRNLCVDLGAMGFRYPGGMAEYVTIPARALQQGHVVKVPVGVMPTSAALAEPVSCCVNAAQQCGIGGGDAVVVLGAGPMGILNACVAREFGAARIILSELNPARLRQAENFGFHRLVNAANEDITKVVKDETGGYGADVAIVTAPAPQPQEQAIGLVRRRGTVCLFASLPPGKSMLALDSRVIHYGEIRVLGTSDSTSAHVERAVQLIAGGALPMSRIATHVMKLDDVLRAYMLMETGEALRIVLTP